MIMPNIESPAEEAQRVDAVIHATLPRRLRASWSTGSLSGRTKTSQRALQRKGARGASSRVGKRRAFLGFPGSLFPSSARMTSHQPGAWDMGSVGACGRVEGGAVLVPASTVFAHPAVL